MNGKGYFISIIISFILISILIIIFLSFSNKKFEKFAIDELIMKDDSSTITTELSNTFIYFKFNNGDNQAGSATNLINNYGSIYKINAISTNCKINVDDYVKGNGCLEFDESGYLDLPFSPSFNSGTFTIAFFIKISKKTNYNKVILSQKINNPSLGLFIFVDGNNNLKINIGTNNGTNWTTIFTYPNFIDENKIDWCHLLLSYNQNSNPKWNLYIDGNKYMIKSTDNPNLTYISTYTSINTVDKNLIILRQPTITPNMHRLLVGATNNDNYFTQYTQSELKEVFASYKINLSDSGVKNSWFSNDKQYLYIKFTSGISTLNCPINCTVDIIVVGGGGGGGRNGGWEGGGGGGGGGVGIGTIKLKSDKIYNISIGNGGNGAINTNLNGLNGENTTIIGENINETAYGGGGGGWQSGNNGASGGGGSGYAVDFNGGISITNGGISSSSTGDSSIKYFGNNGGYGYNAAGGGGGGGAGGIGNPIYPSGKNWYGGNGGAGKIWSYDGNNYGGGGGGAGGTYGGGGGGSGDGGGGSGAGVCNAANGTNGNPNSGGGGGGGNSCKIAGSGGSGVVIIRFATSHFTLKSDNIYKFNTDNTGVYPQDFLPSGSKIDDLRIYNFTLTEDQIKTLYYGTTLASSSSSVFTSINENGINTCGDNSGLSNFTGITYPQSQSSISSIGSINTIKNNNFSQYSQSFKVNFEGINYDYELLFSQVLISIKKPNPFSPIKLFNNNTTTDDDKVNYCAFLSSYALQKQLSDGSKYIYNYNTNGSYALGLSVPDCGNITFSTIRPKGDYIYIKTPVSFVLNRYTIKATNGFVNRAPKSWTLYIYTNTGNKIEYSSPTSITKENYCSKNNRANVIDINYTSEEQKKPSNEYLFVFHSIIGDSPNDRFGILSFEQLILASGTYS